MPYVLAFYFTVSLYSHPVCVVFSVHRDFGLCGNLHVEETIVWSVQGMVVTLYANTIRICSGVYGSFYLSIFDVERFFYRYLKPFYVQFCVILCM